MRLVALRQVGAGFPKMSIPTSEPSFAPGTTTCLHMRKGRPVSPTRDGRCAARISRGVAAGGLIFAVALVAGKMKARQAGMVSIHVVPLRHGLR
jgi:hypothetical protein